MPYLGLGTTLVETDPRWIQMRLRKRLRRTLDDPTYDRRAARRLRAVLDQPNPLDEADPSEVRERIRHMTYGARHAAKAAE